MYPRHRTSLSRGLPVTLALVWLTPFGSVAVAQNASVTQIISPTRAGIPRTPAVNPATYPADTIYVPLKKNTKELLEGWTEYNPNTCQDISTGKYTATTAPMFGKLSYDIQDFTDTSPPCAGTTFPYKVANYKWTSTTSSAPQDFFSLQWTTPDGAFTEDSDWLAELLPPSETTAFKGWATSMSEPTIGQWRQTIGPKTIAYAAVTVQESDPGGGGPDTCWFSGSKFAPFTAITGGTWVVQAGNTWGYDYVGWLKAAVMYYRNKGRAPCGTTFPQQMQVQFATGDTTFYNYLGVNTLGGNIGTTTVTSIRAGKSQTKTWP